jgi:hypothetical protein
LDLDPRGVLGSFQVLGEDRLTGLQRSHATHRGYVDQDPPRGDSGSEVVDAELARPVGRDRLGCETVVHPAVVEDMAQRVDVAGGVTMGGEGEVVGPVALSGGANHVVDDRREVVRPWLGRKGAGTRNGPARPHRRSGGRRDLMRDEVEGADLVIGSPSTPVGQSTHQTQDFVGGHRLTRHRGHSSRVVTTGHLVRPPARRLPRTEPGRGLGHLTCAFRMCIGLSDQSGTVTHCAADLGLWLGPTVLNPCRLGRSRVTRCSTFADSTRGVTSNSSS